MLSQTLFMLELRVLMRNKNGKKGVGEREGSMGNLKYHPGISTSYILLGSLPREEAIGIDNAK